MEGYCFTCGWHTDQLDRPALDPATAMCAWCLARWQPQTRPGGDPGVVRAVPAPAAARV
jgi:hypothetical protein